MIRKLFIHLFLFIFLIIVNLFLVDKTYQYSKKRIQIADVLADISQFAVSYAASPSEGYKAEAIVSDSRVANLKMFFRKNNSPLYDYADSIVNVSDKYQFDYRLLPAIAMQESNLCRVIPDDSHNCWGWGIYGTTVTKFDSYDEAIETVGKGIKKEYIDKGMVTASAIMSKYTPSSPGSWSHGVNTFLKALE
jgi:hypothetical protein